MTRKLDEELLESLSGIRGFFAGMRRNTERRHESSERNHGRYGRGRESYSREHYRGYHEYHEHGHREYDYHERDHHKRETRTLTFAKARVLGVLLKNENGMRQKDIAGNVRMNASSMSELIDRLEQDGYVNRTIDPTDKRATLISLTEMGRARAYEFEDTRDERLDSMFANLNDTEKQELTRLLKKLIGEQNV